MNALETAVRKVKEGLGLTSDSWLTRSIRPAYEVLLRRAYGSQGLARSLHREPPVFLRPECRAFSEEGEAAVCATLKRLAQRGGDIFDVGASIGVYSMLCARWAGANGRVWAFEPAPSALAFLRDHIQMNSLAERILVVAQAVSDQTGETVFYAHGTNGENSLNPAFAERVREAEALRVPVTTLDEFCRAQGVAPSLIKLDVEGYELQVLRGAKETLARHRPALVIEMHPQFWPETGVNGGELARFINSLAGAVTPLEGQDPFREYGHILLEIQG